MSVLDPCSCGFVKAVAYFLFSSEMGISKTEGEKQQQFMVRLQTSRYKEYLELFTTDDHLNVTYKQFRENFSKIIPYFQYVSKRNSPVKNDFLKMFSTAKWKKMKRAEKSQHTLANCQGCLKNIEFRIKLASLPIKAANRKGTKKARDSKLAEKGQILIDTTNKDLKSLDKKYKNKFKIDFNEAVKVYKSNNKENYVTPKVKRKKTKVELEQTTVQKINETWKDTAVEKYLFCFSNCKYYVWRRVLSQPSCN